MIKFFIVSLSALVLYFSFFNISYAEPPIPPTRVVSPELPFTPQQKIKKQNISPVTCRTKEVYTDAKAQVKCVLEENGMLWVWTSGLADRIIYCESRWITTARGDSGRALGLWQIRQDVHPWIWYLYGPDPFDPVTNTAAAVRIYRQAGYSFWPWSCY